MGHQENEVSWQVLRRIVHDWAGNAAELAEVKPLVGGCINTTLALTTTTGERAVIKVSPHRVNRDLEREAHQLDVLRGLGLPAPRVYCLNLASLDNPDTYLLMEFMDGIDLGQARQQCLSDEYDQLQRALAEMVAMLHAHRGADYRRELSPQQECPRFAAWADFYRHVYDPIWHDLEKSHSLPPKVRRHIGKIHEQLDRLLLHDDGPRLVHWDLWATNLLVSKDGQGHWRITALLDPNAKYAHSEAEIAYMELFHTVTPAFIKAYQHHHKLPETYHRVRKPIYQLYPLINHVHLFGHDYLKPLQSALDRAAALV